MRRPPRFLAALLAGGVALATATFVMWAPSSSAQSDDVQVCAARTQPVPDAVVTLKDRQFVPARVELARRGMSVCWQHQDGSTPHTVTFDAPAGSPGAFDSHPTCVPASGDGCWRQGDTTGTVQVIFDTPGTYPYHCKVHADMKGTVVVEGGTPPAGVTTTTKPKPSATTTTTSSTGTTVGAISDSTTTSEVTTTTSESTTTTIGFTTQTTSSDSALGKNASDDDDEPPAALKAIGVVLLAAVIAALIPAWRRLT